MLILKLLLIELLNIKSEFIEEPKDIETIIGSTIIFHCRIKAFNNNEISWCKNDFCTLGKRRDLPFYKRYEIIGRSNQGEHDLKIVNVSMEDIGIYQCQILAGYQRLPSLSRKAKLNILQIPENLTIDYPVILIENIPSNIICRSYNGIPEVKLSWDISNFLNYSSKKDYVFIYNSFFKYSISNITILANRSYHGTLIQCQAHSYAIQLFNKTILTQQFIQIYFPPKLNLNIIGEQIEGKLIFVQCSIECRPNFEKIRWFNGTSLLNIQNQNRLSILLNRYHHLNKITCQVNNQIGITNKSIILNIIYKPIFIDKNSNKLNNYSVVLVNEGEKIHLECLIDSFPLSTIKWIFNKNILSINKTLIKINSIKSIEHIGLYICSVHHFLFGIFNRTIRVALKGPPEMIDEGKINSVYVGQSIKLICFISKDIPFQKIFWSRNDQFIIKSNEKYEINQNEKNHLIQYELLINKIKSSDENIYKCIAQNQYGSSITKFHLKVFNSKYFFIRYTFIYRTILIISFILFILLYRYYKTHQKKSLISNLHISQDFSFNLNYIYQQQLNHTFNQENSSFIKDKPFYMEENFKQYSTAV